METLEIIVYIGIAIIVGGIVLLFLGRIDAAGMYRSVHDTLFGQSTPRYQKIEADQFPLEAYKIWEQCGFGSQPGEATLYVTGSGFMNRTRMFATYKKLNLCSSIQSASEGCGKREDVNITGDIALPAVIRVACDTNSKQLNVTA